MPEGASRAVRLPRDAAHALALIARQGRPPWASIGLAALLLAVFGATTLAGGLDDTTVLGRFGARAPSRLDAEPWRLVIASFLHGGVFHVATNTVALIVLGMVGEGLVGAGAWLATFAVTGVAAQAAGAALGPTATLSVGASGPVFGLAGLLLGTLVRRRREATRPMRALVPALIVFCGWSLALGFLDATLDGWAHVGGLVSGLVLGVIAVPRLAPVGRVARAGWIAATLAGLGVAASGVLAARAAIAPVTLTREVLDAPGVTFGLPTGWRRRTLAPTLISADDGFGVVVYVGRVDLAAGDAAATGRRVLAAIGHKTVDAELPSPETLRAAPVDRPRGGRPWLVWEALATHRGVARLALAPGGGRAWFVLGWAPRAAAPRYRAAFEAVEASFAD